MVLLGALPAAALPRADDLGWTEFRNERFGLALRYPAEVFVSQRSSTQAMVIYLKRLTARAVFWSAQSKTPIASRRGHTRPSLRGSLTRDCASTMRR